MYRHSPDPLEAKRVKEKAEEALKSPHDFGVYDVKTNNCEHFATYCRYGNRFSQQVMKVVQTGAAAAAVAAVAGAVVGAVSTVATATKMRLSRS